MKKFVVCLVLLTGCVSETSTDEGTSPEQVNNAFQQVSDEDIHYRFLDVEKEELPLGKMGEDFTVVGFEFIAAVDGELQLVVHDRVGKVAEGADMTDGDGLKEKWIYASQNKMKANERIRIYLGFKIISGKEALSKAMRILSPFVGSEATKKIKQEHEEINEKRKGYVHHMVQGVFRDGTWDPISGSSIFVNIPPGRSLPDSPNTAMRGGFSYKQGAEGFGAAKTGSIVPIYFWTWFPGFGSIGIELGESGEINLKVDDQDVAPEDYPDSAWVLRMKFTPANQ
jgi:hypothetical protein